MKNKIDEYIKRFPIATEKKLVQMRELIKKNAPSAVEDIKYGIPTFILDGKNLVHFAAYKNHIGFYPTTSPMVFFKKELTQYKQGRGSVQFPFEKPMPLNLIREIVSFRIAEVSKNKIKK